MAFTQVGGGSHEGANWAPGAGALFAGEHTDINRFIVAHEIQEQPYNGSNYGSFEAEAGTVIIEDTGILDGKGAGYGGGGGAAGGGGGCGGWTVCYAYGGDGGLGEAGGSNGGDGLSCINPSDHAGQCQYADGRRGGNGGKGGGPFGGAGGVYGSGGGEGANGQNGTNGAPGGYKEIGGNGDYSEDETVTMGSGGGGGGGAGGGGDGRD